ncbi:MAG: hypothetical protein MJ201_01330 [Mycoplasmoidaceae bacterium]|nr:hypothetical protein [Mycoplasmoidaceae bacterium]
MKKKLILIPITLTALTPMVSMVGCGDSKQPIPEEDDITIEGIPSSGKVEGVVGTSGHSLYLFD